MNSANLTFLQQLTAIIGNTFREAIRDRILYNLVIFVLLITLAAVFLGELTAGQEARVIVNLGLSSILLFGTFISIFVGVSIVWKEIEKRTVYAIFSKPVGRSTFLVGKYLGLCLTLTVNLAIMAAGVCVALIYVNGVALIWPMLAGALLIALELTIVTAVAVMFSSFSTPALSALLTFFVFLIGHFSASLVDFARGIGSASAEAIFSAIYYLLPNFSHFSFIAQSSNGELATHQAIGIAIAYAILFDVIFMSIATAVFSLRNFK